MKFPHCPNVKQLSTHSFPWRLPWALALLALAWLPWRLAAEGAEAADTQPAPLIGAIRWDGQSGGFAKGQIGATEEAALGPAKWHNRLPFFATTPTPDSCTTRETQAAMDQEIAYAKDAGIDFWAFNWYSDNYCLSRGRHLYLQSPHRDDVKYCVIIGKWFGKKKDTIQLVDEMKAPNYQRVLGDRPLVFTLNCKKPEAISLLRQYCRQEHVGDPFVVVMGTQGKQAADLCKKLGGDGISSYTSWISAKGEVPYARFADHQRQEWNQWLKTHRQVIPWVNEGWDPRPRVESYPPHTFAPGYGTYYTTSTPAEFAQQLRQCIDWIHRHPTSCRPNALLCYAWNEFSECGSSTLCPKLSGDRGHLDALKAVVAENAKDARKD